MKILVIGDTHFKVGNVKETREMTKKIVEIAKKKKPDMIVLLGDILDKHEKIHVIPLTNAIDLIKQLKNIAYTYLLIGNHDRPNNSNYLTGIHPFISLREWDNIKIVDEVITFSDNVNLMFIPYVPNGRFQDAINTVEYNNPKIIFAHQEFKGSKMGAIVSIEGDVWPLDNPLVITGHIHDYQEPQGNIIYTGTPIQHGFGDTSDKTISYIEIDKGKIKHKRIDLGLPKKKIIRLSYSQVKDYEIKSENQIKIVITGFNHEIKSLNSSNKIKMWLDMGIKISYKNIRKKEEEYKSLIIKNFKTKFQEEIKDDIIKCKIFNYLFD